MENSHYEKYATSLLNLKAALSLISIIGIFFINQYEDSKVSLIVYFSIPLIGLLLLRNKWKNGYLITIITSLHQISLAITNVFFMLIGRSQLDIFYLITFVFESLLVFYSYMAYFYSDYENIPREYILDIISKYRQKYIDRLGITFNNALLFTLEILFFVIFSFIDFYLTIMYCVLIIWINGINWNSYGFEYRGFRGQIIVSGVCLGIGLVGISVVMQPLYYHLTNGSQIDNFSYIENNLQAYIEILIRTWLYSSFLQEFIYRGYLINRILNYSENKQFLLIIALFGSSILFGLLHLYQGWVGVLNSAVFGLLIGLVYCLRKNIWLLVVMHSVVNTILFTLTYIG